MRNSTISWTSSLASSMPATSSKVMPVRSLSASWARLLPKDSTPPPPHRRSKRTKDEQPRQREEDRPREELDEGGPKQLVRLLNGELDGTILLVRVVGVDLVNEVRYVLRAVHRDPKNPSIPNINIYDVSTILPSGISSVILNSPHKSWKQRSNLVFCNSFKSRDVLGTITVMSSNAEICVLRRYKDEKFVQGIVQLLLQSCCRNKRAKE